MATRHDEAVRLLDVPAADYFTFNPEQQSRLQDALARLASGSDLSGQAGDSPLLLALGAPKSVDLDRQPKVPVLVGSVQTGLRAWHVNPITNLHLLMRNLSTGELSAAQALLKPRRGKEELRSGKGTPPDEIDAQTVRSSVAQTDLREIMPGSVKPGVFSITAVANELRSNTVSMRMEGRAAPQESAPASPQPYLRHTLEPRAAFTTRVEVPKVATATDPLLVRVAIQIDDSAGVLQAASERPLWPCHLIFVKLDERPRIVAALVPVRRIVAASGKTVFNAVFQIDIRAAAPALAGSYQVYLDAGREVIGPYPLAINGS